MRIGINALLVSAAQSYRNAGISRYTLSLLNALSAFDSTHHYSVFVSERRVAEQVPTPTNGAVVVVGRSALHPARRVLWEHLLFAGEIHKHRLQLFHAPMNILPTRLPCPGIITIHDLAFLRFPHFFRPTRRAYQQVFTPRSARQAALIIAVSEHTRQDIVELLKIPEERIRVIPPILEERFWLPSSPEAITAFRQRMQLQQPFILFLATLEPRKNIFRLLAAYRLLKREAKLPHLLVLAGAKGWYMQPVERQVHALGIEKDVRFAGYVPEEEKTLWYHAADLFVYPSLYEGFGLPVAEAMACGLPVVTSNTSSLPEVVGNDGNFGEQAALTVDPHDTEALAQSMLQLLGDVTLRQQYRLRGLARSQRFAPEPIARQIIQAYDAAASAVQF